MNRNLLLILMLAIVSVVVVLLFLQQTPSPKNFTIPQEQMYNSSNSSHTAHSIAVKYVAVSSASAKKDRDVKNEFITSTKQDKYIYGSNISLYSSSQMQASKKIENKNISSTSFHNIKAIQNSSNPTLEEYKAFYGDRIKNMPLEKVKKELPPPPPFPSVE